MKMRLVKKAPNVYVAYLSTQYELCMTFVRMQEFYESPEFKGKYFTLEEFMDHWAVNFGGGSFDYTSEWTGFNLPGTIIMDWLREFYYAPGREMRAKEHEFIEKLFTRLNRDKVKLEDCYIIGVSSDDDDIKNSIDHELAHAFYHLYPKYKKSCDKLLKSDKHKELVKFAKAELKDLGYGDNVLLDEVQAFWSASTGDAFLEPQEDFQKNFIKFRKSLQK